MNDSSSSSIGGENVYNGKREKQVLASLLDSYSRLEIIFISVSGPSSYSILYFILTTSTTNYYLKKNIYNFDIRKLFYSKQDLKNTYHFPAYTSYKRTNNTELINKKE